MKTKTAIGAIPMMLLSVLLSVGTVPVAALADTTGSTEVTVIRMPSDGGDDTAGDSGNVTVVAPVDRNVSKGQLARTGDSLLLSAALIAASGMTLALAGKMDMDS